MKPILYDSTAAVFDNNGIGILADAVSCVVTEERNSVYELTMEYPITGMHFNEIAGESIIKAKPNLTDDPQPFRVYRVTTPFNGVVTVYARHISYDLSGIPIQPFSAASAPAAMAGMAAHSAVPNPFTFWTDKTTAANFTVGVPSSARSLLGGQKGSLLDVYGGEYAYDGYTVRLYAARGENRGVSIRYGKNLTSLEQDENCANVYTGVYPYWTDGTVLVQLSEKIINVPGSYDFERILTLDASQYFDGQPTEEQLRARTERYIEDNEIGVPTVSLSVSFVQLEQTEEYRHLALLERVSLCDTVNVEFPAMGVSATAKCVKTEYDTLMGRYKSVDLGDARTNIADTIVEQQKQIERAPSTSFLQQAISNATALITGNNGGFVVLHSSTGAKEPDEILVMDTEDIKTATKVWRWNKSGLGYSANGYNGPYALAMTQDGAIVADFITAGGMNAARITAGVLTSADGSFQLDLTGNTITIRDSENNLKLGFDADGNLTISGTINADAGEIGGWSIREGGLYTGASAAPTLYLGSAGIAATVAGASRTGIVLKAGSNFGVDTGGNLYANNAQLVGGSFSGNLSAAGGTFKGNLSAAGGTFKGNLSAAGGTFAGELKAASGTFSGELEAATGTFSGNLSAAKGTFAGNLSAAGGTFAGELQAASGTFSGELEAATGTFSGNLSAAKGTFAGNLSAAGGTFAGELQAASGTFSGELEAASGTFEGDLIAETTYFRTLICSEGSTYVEIMDDHIQCGPVIIDGAGMEIDGAQDEIRFWMLPPTASGGSEARWVMQSNGLYSLGIYTSRRSDKKDIAQIGDECSKIIDAMNPVYFRFLKDDTDTPPSMGFIAEEMHEACPSLTAYAHDGTPNGIQYSNITALLVAEMKRLRKRVAAVEETVKELTA